MLDTSHKKWLPLSQTCSKMGNIAQVYEFRKLTWKTEQKGRPVSEYYANLIIVAAARQLLSEF